MPEGVPKAVVLHLHGGGFRLGAPEMIGPYAHALARRCAVEVIVPEYRLAPENPFPAGLNDALACVRAMVADHPNALPLIVAGDSAGGGLAASVATFFSGADSPVAGLILLSAWLDLTVSAGSYAENAASDSLFTKKAAEAAAELYLQGSSADHPLASPLSASVESYPPTLIGVGSGEVLLDDSLRFNAKLLAAGTRTELCVIPGMEHTAVVRDFGLPGASEMFERVCRFIATTIVQAGA